MIRSLELPVELIYIEVTDDDSVGYCQQPKGSTLDDFDEGVVKIAGEVAENLYLPPSPEDLSEIRWSKDREELEACISKIQGYLAKPQKRSSMIKKYAGFVEEVGETVCVDASSPNWDMITNSFNLTQEFQLIPDFFRQSAYCLARKHLLDEDPDVLRHLTDYVMSRCPNPGEVCSWRVSGADLDAERAAYFATK